VTLYDVGPRDGLQNEPEVLEVDVRAELVRRLADAGLRGIEVASFVDPRRVPQMAHAEEVVAAVGVSPGVIRAGLALNERGYDRLLASGLDEVRFAFGVTETFNGRNQGASVDESVTAARRIAARARGDGLRCAVTLSVAFGCPFEGEVDPDLVIAIAERVAAVEPDALVLADTIGVASPRAVTSLTERVAELGDPSAATSTTRATRGTRTRSRSRERRVRPRRVDRRPRRLPVRPNATGNIATDDLVYLLEREGVATGIDIDRLIATSEWLSGLLGRRLEGQLYRAGLPAERLAARGQDRPANLGELEVAGSATEHDLVVVLEERPRRSVCQPDRVLPVRVSSMSEPSVPCSGPEMVPDANRSPVAIEAPFTVACASCCGIVQ
jgi:hydroxymethylglutaryl-CoA lyase/(R)-citramalyl-CoA lyase